MFVGGYGLLVCFVIGDTVPEHWSMGLIYEPDNVDFESPNMIKLV